MVDPCFHRDGFYGAEDVAAAMSAAVESSSLNAVLPVAGLAPGFEAGVVVLAGLGDGDCTIEARYEVGPRDHRYIAELRLRFEV
jgi:hypothetical protein